MSGPGKEQLYSRGTEWTGTRTIPAKAHRERLDSVSRFQMGLRDLVTRLSPRHNLTGKTPLWVPNFSFSPSNMLVGIDLVLLPSLYGSFTCSSSCLLCPDWVFCPSPPLSSLWESGTVHQSLPGPRANGNGLRQFSPDTTHVTFAPPLRPAQIGCWAWFQWNTRAKECVAGLLRQSVTWLCVASKPLAGSVVRESVWWALDTWQVQLVWMS